MATVISRHLSTFKKPQAINGIAIFRVRFAIVTDNLYLKDFAMSEVLNNKDTFYTIYKQTHC